jgi:hypothetical protein
METDYMGQRQHKLVAKRVQSLDSYAFLEERSLVEPRVEIGTSFADVQSGTDALAICFIGAKTVPRTSIRSGSRPQHSGIDMRRVGNWLGGLVLTGMSIVALASATGAVVVSVVLALAAFVWLVFFADIGCST